MLSLTRGRVVDIDNVALSGTTGGELADETEMSGNDLDRLAPRASVAWTAPVCVYMWVIWAPEPVVPSPKDQAYPVKVPGPPVAEAVNVTFEPGAAAAWFADAITEGAGLMATDVESVALTIVASVTVHVTAMVPVAW